jgi:peptidoglycan/LPS O-acetylase OafA/YrhL
MDNPTKIPVQKINSLSSLRFIAASMIVVHHSRGMLWLTPDTFKNIPLDHAVSFFFVLSGFVLTHVYLSRSFSAVPFYMARFARIWPLHVFAFLTLLIVCPYLIKAPSAVPLAALNLSLVHSWIPIGQAFFSYNWLSWAVSVEVFFYLVFPLLIKDFERTWIYKLCGSLLLVTLLMAVCHYVALPPYSQDTMNKISSTGVLYINPLSRLFEFVLGMSTALLWKTYSHRITLSPSAGSLLEISALCGVMLSLYYSLPLLAAVYGFIGPVVCEYLSHTLSALPIAALIFVIALQKGALSSLLKFRPLVLLGNASFAIFLFHQIILRFYLAHAEYFHPLPIPLLYVFFWVFLILFSLTVTYVVERPAQRFITNITNT